MWGAKAADNHWHAKLHGRKDPGDDAMINNMAGGAEIRDVLVSAVRRRSTVH